MCDAEKNTDSYGYWNEQEFCRLIDLARYEGKTPGWLFNVLDVVPSIISSFPDHQETKDYVVEFFYPH